MTKDHWTPTLVEERLVEAASVMKRLPNVRVPGYFNTWPKMLVEFADLIEQEPARLRLPPPAPDAITRMEEALGWLVWLDPIDSNTSPIGSRDPAARSAFRRRSRVGAREVEERRPGHVPCGRHRRAGHTRGDAAGAVNRWNQIRARKWLHAERPSGIPEGLSTLLS